jgi:hypothetical protein
MTHSTLASLLLATPFAHDLLPLAEQLLPTLERLGRLIQQFRTQPITPQATAAFENQLLQQVRELGRTAVEWAVNHIEPDDPALAPERLHVEGQTYRRRGKHPRHVATLFGSVRLRRRLYEPLEPGERCLHPLERQLGLEAGCATPALAERVGLWAAQHPQRAVLHIVQREYAVAWSAKTLRKVTASLAAGLAARRHSVQCRRLLGLLQTASASKGSKRPVLAVGRDGIHVPLVRDQYREGAAGTVTVYDRRGRRLGTVYVGRMPEPGQGTLSAQLTALLQEVLQAWEGPMPRLAYITDGGWHPTEYYRKVLRRMENPRRPGERLVWVRVIDFYHAAQYVTRLAEALFGDTKRGRAWGRRMRKRLKESAGVTRVLQSASYHHNQRELSAGREEAFWEAHEYLRKRGQWMDYGRYRREGVPLGSGVTEAACKTVFTQRLKQSGMKWAREGGQVIVDLRVVLLSGVWDEAYTAYLQSKTPEFGYTTSAYAAPRVAEVA